MSTLTPQQLAFFETFGYLSFPQLLKEEIGWIIDEFEGVFENKQISHDGSLRTCLVPFADQSERLCTLLDMPAIHDIATSLLGPDFNYLGSDGNYYTGDTGWHSDGFHAVGRYIKLAFYLDPVAGDSGALRVVPGSHLPEAKASWERHPLGNARNVFGIEQSQIPSQVLATTPGDLLVFNHNIYHASFGGSARRRMFTLNLSSRAQTPEELEDLRGFIGSNARFWVEHVHSEIMRGTASPQRQVHLQQVMENEDMLPELVARAKATMKEPSRG